MSHPQVEVQKAPVIAISSTYIRDAIWRGDVQFLLPDAVVAHREQPFLSRLDAAQNSLSVVRSSPWPSRRWRC